MSFYEKLNTLTYDNIGLYKVYFQKSENYYLNQIDKYLNTGKNSFSVKAFFLGIFWMAYRKMYKQILIITAIIIGVMLFEEFLLEIDVFTYDAYLIIYKLSVVFWIALFGFIGNKLYILKCTKDIERILQNNSDEEKIEELVKLKGGVNWIAPIIVLTVTVGVLLWFSGYIK